MPKVAEGIIEASELPETGACSVKEGVAKEGVVIVESSDTNEVGRANNEQMDGANTGEGVFEMDDSTDKQIGYSSEGVVQF